VAELVKIGVYHIPCFFFAALAQPDLLATKVNKTSKNPKNWFIKEAKN